MAQLKAFHSHWPYKNRDDLRLLTNLIEMVSEFPYLDGGLG